MRLLKYKKQLLIVVICLASLGYYLVGHRAEEKIKVVDFWQGFEWKKFTYIHEVIKESGYSITDKDFPEILLIGPFSKDNKKVGSERKLGLEYQYSDINSKKKTNQVRIFFTGENIRIKPDKYDLSIGFDHINDRDYIRFPLYYIYFKDKVSTKYGRGKCNPQKKYFACFLYSNGGSDKFDILDGVEARDSIFKKLGKYKFVVSGGPHLNNIGYNVPRDKTNEWLSECKFIIAYENASYPGYITEKLLQAYLAGSVPIYYGHRKNLDDVNPKAFVFAKDFSSEEKLVDYIKQLDNNDKEYCKIWNKKIITDPSRNYKVQKKKLKEKISEAIKRKLER